ncbi:hypothetical protein BJX61DRAFT_530117 [Aspergillus egyptiacus]|nr:hypothetical protein BJX61DRAFT_530117 [Aspergillus egyptiacus]
MTASERQAQSLIDKRDFDTNRRLSISQGSGAQEDHALLQSRPDSRLSASNRLGPNDYGLLSDVVEEIVERDRRKIAREVVRICSFVWGVVTW